DLSNGGWPPRASDLPMQMATKNGPPSPPSWSLWLLGPLLVAITIAAAIFMVWDLRQEAIKNVRGEVNNLGIVIAEQTSRSLQAVDLVLRETGHAVRAAGGTTPQQFTNLMGTEATHYLLQQQVKNLPQVDALALISVD